ncbi:NAD(P)/FAD-dependent oxidoreductase [Paracoccus pacificus]|uniref:NAD(P)/FAD-dependent oxidoreductase n=1 Tax=Paracoccus pacificus TaxID=1463598 RepID=A0ABW4R9J8_9RHOB
MAIGKHRVTVMGGGIFGLSCAYACQRLGARVTVIEKRRIGAGSSGGTVGALAPHVPENWNPKKQFQIESLLMAADFWAGVAGLSGIDPGYARTGRIQPLQDDADIAKARARAAGAAKYWPAWAWWRVEVATDAFSPLSPTGLVLSDGLTARLDPRAALAALAGAIEAAGGAIAQGDRPPDDGAPVIWATGAEGLAMLSEDLGRLVGNGVKGQSATLGFSAPDAPQIYADGLHIVPHADGTTGIGSTSERGVDDPATDEGLETLIARARAVCPALADAPVIDRWAGFRPRAVSRAPLLGAWPGRPGHYVANGGFKIGFGMAPKVAQVMADLVLNGRDAIPEGFRLV